ncbi:Microtubule-associated protein SPIRAL2-like [Platanthera zijinensis]|uniref:Microtubule-associated protein SPIRAL2-like n=1 Tax=Platanthera zijinensis TaxID=2320716 RepID=A0AAP0BRM8_9ASPA
MNLVMESGADFLGIPAEVKRGILLNLDEASMTMETREDADGAYRWAAGGAIPALNMEEIFVLGLRLNGRVLIRLVQCTFVCGRWDGYVAECLPGGIPDKSEATCVYEKQKECGNPALSKIDKITNRRIGWCPACPCRLGGLLCASCGLGRSSVQLSSSITCPRFRLSVLQFGNGSCSRTLTARQPLRLGGLQRADKAFSKITGSPHDLVVSADFAVQFGKGGGLSFCPPDLFFVEKC